MSDIKISNNNIAFYKFTLGPTNPSPFYVRTRDKINKNLLNVGGIIPFSLAVQGDLYAHVGDAGSEPNTIDSNGFWVYHNANITCWFSAILVF